MQDSSILVIDDSKNVLQALELLLQFEFKQVETLSNPNQLTSFQNLMDVDLILLDMNFSAGVNTGNEGLFWLRHIRKKAPDTAVIMMTAYGGVDLAVQALKEGASDFILKPWNNDKLMATLNAALELRKSRKEVGKLKEKAYRLKEGIKKEGKLMVGNSLPMNRVQKLTAKVARTEVNVLITGENGTGKELIARQLHQQSSRCHEIFVDVDMGSIAENLFESELFGHVKGAFTDAREDRVGKFEAAHQGTLFLDEIGNLSLQMQAKLLSAIQNRSIVRVGSNTPIAVDIRLICATNSNLEKMVAEGLFREDLLYRINTIRIEVPPLRERGDDIALLAEFFLNRFSSKYNKPGLKMNQGALDRLCGYPWPGNVRELQHTVERAVILADGNVLKAEDFPLHFKEITSYTELPDTLDEMEQVMIQRALDEHQGNFSAAAQQLGISRQTLYNKIKKYDQ